MIFCCEHRLAENPLRDVANVFAVAKLGGAHRRPDKCPVLGGGNGKHPIVRQAVLVVEFFRTSAFPVDDAAVTSADPEISLAAPKRRDRNVSKARVKRFDGCAVVSNDSAF